jgi:hypothetical protein
MSTTNSIKCTVDKGNNILQTDDIQDRDKALFKIIALIKYRCKEHKELTKLVDSLKCIKTDCKIIIDDEFADIINLYKSFDYHILKIATSDLAKKITFFDFFNEKGLLSDEYLYDKNNVIFKLYIDPKNDRTASYIILKKNDTDIDIDIDIFYIDVDIYNNNNIKCEQINTRPFEKIISNFADRYSTRPPKKYKYLNISINKLKKAEAFNNNIRGNVNVTPLPSAPKNNQKFDDCLNNIIKFLYDNLKTKEKREEYIQYLIDITTNSEHDIIHYFTEIETDERNEKEKNKEDKTDGFYQLNIAELADISNKNITFLDFFNKYILFENISYKYDGRIFEISGRGPGVIFYIYVILIYREEKVLIYRMKSSTYPFMSSDITKAIFKYTDEIIVSYGPGREDVVQDKLDFNNICINNKYLADTYQFQ